MNVDEAAKLRPAQVSLFLFPSNLNGPKMKGPGKAAGYRTQGLETQKQMMQNISQRPRGYAFSATLILQG